MSRIKASNPPPNSLLAAYDLPGNHTDCFVVQVDGPPDLQRFIGVFFDTWVFRLERLILAVTRSGYIGRDLIDALAKGETGTMGAWMVEGRRETEVMLRVKSARIDTWLGVAPVADDPTQARLLFGTALDHIGMGADDRGRWAFDLTLPLHLLYARILLRAAVRDWERGKGLDARQLA